MIKAGSLVGLAILWTFIGGMALRESLSIVPLKITDVTAFSLGVVCFAQVYLNISTVRNYMRSEV